jgi:hypothetical protein
MTYQHFIYRGENTFYDYQKGIAPQLDVGHRLHVGGKRIASQRRSIGERHTSSDLRIH